MDVTEQFPKSKRLLNVRLHYSPTFVAALLLSIFLIQALATASRLSATSDEPVHIAAGYSYWKTRDFRMNPEHPPLAKLLAALPLIVLGPRVPLESAAWDNSNQGAFGFDFLYLNDADRLLFWSRLPLILIAGVGALATFAWARDLYGSAAGLTALAFYAFSPNLLAHATLVTMDAPLTAFTVLALYLFWRNSEHQSWIDNVWTGIATGAGMSVKFSGALIPITLASLSCIRVLRAHDRQLRIRIEAASLSIIAAAAIFVIEASYLFSASPLLYFRNAGLVNANHNPDYFFYLFGQLKQHGWWYYFPLAFAIKATVSTLVLTGLTALRIREASASAWGDATALSAIVLFTVVTAGFADPIGIRYLLPVFALIFVWGSAIVPLLVRVAWGKAVLAGLIAWHAWSGLSAFPNYIPYFNEIAGGAANGHEYLDDSNVDWGQGLKQAAEYVRDRELTDVVMYSFSPLDNPPYYGLPANLVGQQVVDRLLFKKPVPGTYIISSHHLVRMKLIDPAWRSYRVIDRIGDSLWVYRF